jgi:hypothetical protein
MTAYQLEITPKPRGGVSVLVDGHDISPNVTEIIVGYFLERTQVMCKAVITLTANAGNTKIDSNVIDFSFNGETINFLRALGWRHESDEA